MENANKIISFILGLIVVVVFIAIVTGKFNLGKKIKTLSKVTPTTTPKVTPKVTPEVTKKVTITYPSNTQAKTAAPQGYNQQKTQPAPAQKKAVTSTGNYQAKGTATDIYGNSVSNIPNTGAPTLLLPTAFSLLAGGTFLKRLSRKK